MGSGNGLFELSGKVAVVTGGAGVLGSNMAMGFSNAGVSVVILDIRESLVEEQVKKIRGSGGVCMGIVASVLDEAELRSAVKEVLKVYGRIDILVNAAGGNTPGGTLGVDQSVFDMKIEEFKRVTELNMDGTVIPTLVLGQEMANRGEGSVVNISSMASYSAITRVPGYSVAKSGVDIFTKWMAAEMSRKYGDKVRVNAVAPGFFIGDQNRAVLLNPDGSLTDRSERVIAKTPMGRFGDISELNGVVQFLCSPAASFITGVIIPVDGGFSSFSGV